MHLPQNPRGGGPLTIVDAACMLIHAGAFSPYYIVYITCECYC